MLRLVLIFIVALPLMITAQTTPLNAFFDDSIEEPGFSSSEIQTRDVSFEWEDEPGTEQVREVLDGIESIRILKFDQTRGEAKKDISQVYRKVEKAIEKDDYQEAMTFSSDEDKVHIYFLKEGDEVKEFALISKGTDKVTVITVTGDLDLAMMMSKETLKGLWSLKSIYSEGKHMHIDMDVDDDDEER